MCVLISVDLETRPGTCSHHAPGSHVVCAQNVGFSSDMSPQSLSPSQSQRERMHTLWVPHDTKPGRHVTSPAQRERDVIRQGYVRA